MKLFKKKATPSEFYVNCVKATHDLAMKQGLIKGGTKLIPELLPYGVQLLQLNLFWLCKSSQVLSFSLCTHCECSSQLFHLHT